MFKLTYFLKGIQGGFPVLTGRFQGPDCDPPCRVPVTHKPECLASRDLPKSYAKPKAKRLHPGFQCLRGTLDRCTDSHISGATADIAVHRHVDVTVIGVWHFCKQCGGSHDLPGLAIAALRNLVLDPGGLNRLGLACRDRFYGNDLGIANRRDGQGAGAQRLLVHEYGACTALADPAPIFRAGQAKIVPQNPEQRRVALCVDGVPCAIHVDGKCHEFPVSSFARTESGRLRLAATYRKYYSIDQENL